MSSSKCEGERLHARCGELDFEYMILDLSRLPYQLIQPVTGDDSVALFVGIFPVLFSGRMAVDGYSIVDGLALGPGTEDKMQIARVESKPDLATRGKACRGLAPDNPAAGERPFVGRQIRRRGIHLRVIVFQAASGGKMLCAFISNVSLGREHVCYV